MLTFPHPKTIPAAQSSAISKFPLNGISGNHFAVPDNWITYSTNKHILNSNVVTATPVFYESEFEFNELLIVVNTGSATDVVQIGLAECAENGLPGDIIEVVTADVTQAGTVVTSLSQTYTRPGGRYFTLASTKDTTARMWGVDFFSHAGRCGFFYFGWGRHGSLYRNIAADGIIPNQLNTPDSWGNTWIGGNHGENIMVLPRHSQWLN